jgi:hypothetical protein
LTAKLYLLPELKEPLVKRETLCYTGNIRGEEMSDYPPKPIKENVIRSRVEEHTFRRVMAIAHKYDTTMSDVVRLCVEGSIDRVEQALRTASEARAKIKPAL